MAAVVFIISCMPVPVPTAGTCSHPCGTGMAAILLGPFVSSLIAAVALLLQALFLSHGGLSTWGANIFSMGVVGSVAGYFTFKGLRAMGVPLGTAAFFAGLQADWATYLATSVELASGIRGSEPFLPLLEKILLAFVPTQLPLGILEGAMTAGMVMLLYRKRPDILVTMRVIAAGEVTAHGIVEREQGTGYRVRVKSESSGYILFSTGIITSFLLTVCRNAFGAERWPGVDESVVEKFASEHGRESRNRSSTPTRATCSCLSFSLPEPLEVSRPGITGGCSWKGKARSTETARKRGNRYMGRGNFMICPKCRPNRPTEPASANGAV